MKAAAVFVSAGSQTVPLTRMNLLSRITAVSRAIKTELRALPVSEDCGWPISR